MANDPHTIIEVCVEIREERQASFGVKVLGNPPKLIWLPKTEIRTIQRQAGGAAVVEIPRWLADKEGLIEAVEPPDPNQGILL